MTTPSVPTPSDRPGTGEPAAPAARRRRRWWVLGSVAVVVAVLVAGLLLVPVPYYLLQPGSVRPAEGAVSIEGAESFDDDGELMFTTVYVDQATLASLLRGQLDDAIEIQTEEDVYGPEGRDASRKANQQRMDLSKLVATSVALDHLGIENEMTASGAKVLELSEDSASEGLLRPGDVITAVDANAVSMPADIGTAMGSKRPGDQVTVTALRPGPASTGDGEASGQAGDATEVTAEVTLGESVEEPGRPVLGVVVEPFQPVIDSEVQVSIDSGEVTGPSAGLAWALAVVDRLTPGSLTGDGDVAVTGEILADGTVAPIGGVVQKVSAVKRAGVTKFLYPASTPEDEQEEMRRVAGDEVELVPVGSLAEAIDALAPEGVSLPR